MIRRILFAFYGGKSERRTSSTFLLPFPLILLLIWWPHMYEQKKRGGGGKNGEKSVSSKLWKINGGRRLSGNLSYCWTRWREVTLTYLTVTTLLNYLIEFCYSSESGLLSLNLRSCNWFRIHILLFARDNRILQWNPHLRYRNNKFTPCRQILNISVGLQRTENK